MQSPNSPDAPTNSPAICRSVVIFGYIVHNVDMSKNQQGAQVLHRAAGVLRELSARGPTGLSTTELAREVGLTRSTAHRILNALEHEGMVDRDTKTGLWFLGAEVYIWGKVATKRFEILPMARRVLEELARSTGESAFLSVRRGDETVCLLGEEGSFPLRSFVLYEGIRLPLGVASAGIAILAFMTVEEINGFFLRVNLAERFGAPHLESAVRKRLGETRLRGYSINPGLLVEGSWGIAAAIFPDKGSPTWALSLTGVESRFSQERMKEMGNILLDASHQLTSIIKSARL